MEPRLPEVMVIGCAAPDPRAQPPAKKVRFGVDRVFGQYGFEINALVDVARMMFVQPVLQYFVNVGGSGLRAVVFGLRTKVDF